MRTRCSTHATGFSLPELIGVLTVLAVVAVTAIPAVRMLGDTRAAEVVVRLEDALRQARAAAVGRGIPCGVRFDINARTASLVALEQALVVPMLDVFGQPMAATALGTDASSGILHITGGSKAGNNAEVWFDPMGGHASVAENGDVSALTTDAAITLATGALITVRGTTGTIE